MKRKLSIGGIVFATTVLSTTVLILLLEGVLWYWMLPLIPVFIFAGRPVRPGGPWIWQK